MVDGRQGAPENVPWRHHTVPELLLKAFVNRKGHVWTRLVKDGRVVSLSIHDASVRSGFYAREDGTVALETFYANEIESPFGLTVSQGALALPGTISNRKAKKTISLFFLSQFLRVNSSREAYQRRTKAYLADKLPQYHARVGTAAAEIYGEPYGPTEQAEAEQNLIAQALRRDRHIDFTKEMIEKHAPELEMREWLILHVPVGRDELILSDAPAKVLQIGRDGGIRPLDHEGVARGDVSLFMPISPFLGLLGTNLPHVVAQLRTLDISALNAATAAFSSQIYARSKELLVSR